MRHLIKFFAISGILLITAAAQQKQFKNINKKPVPAGKSVEGVNQVKRLNEIGKKLETILQKKGITPVRNSFNGPDLFSVIKNQKFSPADLSDVKSISWNKEFNTPRFILAEKNAAQKQFSVSEQQLKNTASDFLIEKKKLLQLKDPAAELLPVSVNKDKLGMTHIRYQQRYKGIEVWGKQVIVHFDKNGNLESLNGAYSSTPEEIQNVNEQISSESAVSIAFNSLSAKQKIISFTDKVKKLLEYEGPSAKKIIWHDAFNKPHLVWLVELRPNMMDNWYYFIDANSGSILSSINKTCTLDGPSVGTGHDLQGEMHSFGTYQIGSDYYLIDASQSMFNTEESIFPSNPKGAIATYDFRYSADNNFSFDYYVSGDNTWIDSASVSAHVNAEKTYKYFLNEHSRNSLDDKGMNIRSFVHFTETGVAHDNAGWNGKYIVYGDGNVQFKNLAGGLDVAGHEFTHGVVSYSANLVYREQSGALNESFADVFGVLIDTLNWTLGEDVILPEAFPSGAMRDMSDPHSGNQPQIMSEFIVTDLDHGGVHINSGIPNHAFYLTAVNIGREDAGKIWYRALTAYLTPFSNFIDLRIALIKSAEDLFGNESPQLQAVKDALDAVEIFDGEGSNPPPPSTLEGEEWVLFTNSDPLDLNTLYMATALQTSPPLQVLSNTKISNRPAVSDASGIVIFVDDQNYLRMLDADPVNPQEVILDSSGIWSSVAIGPDLSSIALTSIYADTSIYYYDMISDSSKIFKIKTPSYDVENTSTSVYADALSIDPFGQYILYDNYNESTSVTGDKIGYWNINLLEISSGHISTVLPPLDEGDNAGNPSFSKTSTYRFTFDLLEDSLFSIFTADFYNKKLVHINRESSKAGYPSFSADDRTLLFAADDHLFMQRLADDFLTDEGDAEFYTTEATYPIWFVIGNRITGLEENELKVVKDFSLMQNYPNPFNPSTKIDFNLPSSGHVTLKIYDMLGREVKTLVDNFIDAGSHSVNFDAAALPSGIYIYKITAGRFSGSNKMMLLK